VIVGMHPDEVTEAIVDAAIAARTPFAVVPCCVFSRLFPGRQLRSGEPIASHGSLVRYLQEKHPNARTARLGFAGKNTVVYCVDYGDHSQESGCEPCAAEQDDVDVPDAIAGASHSHSAAACDPVDAG